MPIDLSTRAVFEMTVEQLIGHLRAGTDQHRLYRKVLDESLEKIGKTYEEVSTSRSELEECRVKGCRIAARMYVSVLRGVHFDPLQRLELVRKLRLEIGEGGFPPEDVTTSLDEISSFEKESE